MKFRILILAVVAVLITSPARADLIGDSITLSGIAAYPTTATVGAGVEFTGFNGFLTYDFGANTLTVRNPDYYGTYLISWGAIVGPYTFTGFTETINSLSIISNTGFYGNIVTNFSYGPNSITLDMDDGGASANSELVFGINSAPNSVPETCTTLALLGSTFLGLAAFRRRFIA